MKKNDLNEFPLTTKVIFYVHRLTSTMRNKRSCCDCVYFFFSRKCWVTCMKVVWAHFFVFWKQVKSSEYFWLSFTFSEKKRRKAAKNNKNDNNGEKKHACVFVFQFVGFLFGYKCVVSFVHKVHARNGILVVDEILLLTKWKRMKMKIIMSGCIRRTHEKSSRITKYTTHSNDEIFSIYEFL